MTVRALLRQPSGYLPLAMSAAALVTVAWFVAVHGVVHEPDESGHARLWQLLMALQLPLIASFALTRLPKAPRPALAVLALQAGAAIVLGIVPLWVLGGL